VENIGPNRHAKVVFYNEQEPTKQRQELNQILLLHHQAPATDCLKDGRGDIKQYLALPLRSTTKHYTFDNFDMLGVFVIFFSIWALYLSLRIMCLLPQNYEMFISLRVNMGSKFQAHGQICLRWQHEGCTFVFLD